MLVTMRRIVLAVLVVALHGEGAESQSSQHASASQMFTRLQEAWLAGDASGLAEHVGRRGVSIGMPEVEPVGGQFSRSQSYYILRNHFATTLTQEFELEHIGAPERDDRVALALAIRRYRERGNARVMRDRVLVALRREDERWVLSEIRALR